jgi:hypothetical protein
MIERLRSVDQTSRLQRRSLYAYLVDVLAAKARGDHVRTSPENERSLSSRSRPHLRG